MISESIVAAPSLLMGVPFVTLLGAIAALPLIATTSHWWEKNRSKLLTSFVLGVVVVGHYGFRSWGYHEAQPGIPSVVAVLEHAILQDYLPFLVLLFSLYVISGGIWVEGDIRTLPIVNTAFLAFGAVAASLIGTTGASMIFIRPLLQTNSERVKVRHTVVFLSFSSPTWVGVCCQLVIRRCSWVICKVCLFSGPYD